MYSSGGTDILNIERLMDVRIRYDTGGSITTSLDWTPIMSIVEIANWGNNFFYKFPSPVVLQNLYVDLRMQGAQTAWYPSLGAILAGRLYAFPKPIMAPMARGLSGGAIVTGRPTGPVVTRVREKTLRSWQMRTRFDNESQRLELERYLANRGRGTNSHPMLMHRLDLPTVFIGPDMWYSTASDYGTCAFGRFTASAQQTVIGGGAYVDLVFEENA
jgi:hypothetical protein